MSLEDRFAKRLKLKIGDQIEYNFWISIAVIVTSIRSADWGTFKPNFFMIVESPYLDTVSQTWICSIKTTNAKESYKMKVNLTKAFPNISIIDIEKTSKKIIGFLKSVILAIKIGAFYCFTIGLLLFILLGKLFSK